MAWTVDTPHSSVEFSLKHMMISTVRGRFDSFQINANVDETDITRSTIEATIDVASINTRDERRDGHLRSGDFFDAEKYPTITFRSTSITPHGRDTYALTGDLTIKDVTKPATFTVHSAGRGKDPWGNEHWGFNAETTISRKEWGLNWNVALETGGVLVGDDVKISLELELVPAPKDVAESAQAETTVSASS